MIYSNDLLFTHDYVIHYTGTNMEWAESFQLVYCIHDSNWNASIERNGPIAYTYGYARMMGKWKIS